MALYDDLYDGLLELNDHDGTERRSYTAWRPSTASLTSSISVEKKIRYFGGLKLQVPHVATEEENSTEAIV